MLLRYGKPKDSEKIMDFLNSIFNENSINTYCSNFKEKLEKETYKSLIIEDKEQIIAHSGISIVDNIAIFNMLSVDLAYRNKGLAKKLLEESINYSIQQGNITHVVGYCVLHHPWSEKIHDGSFKPVGLMFTDERPLIKSDPLYKQNLFTGNLVLCKQLKDINNKKIIVNYKGVLEERFMETCLKIGIDLNFVDSVEQKSPKNLPEYIEVSLNNLRTVKYLKFIEKQDYVFLGMVPSISTGLLTFGFMLKNDRIYDNLEIRVSNEERKKFIEKILVDMREK